MKVLLLFGLPESGIQAAARAIHAGGAALAVGAATGAGRYAVSPALDRLATEINAAFAIADEPIGPVALANTPLPESALRIAAALRPWRPIAMDALAGALTKDQSDAVVIAAGAMSAFPSFWLDALRDTGTPVTPVLIHRNPIVVAQLARANRSRPLRQTIFQWHHLAIATLHADPGTAAVLNSPDFNLHALNAGLARATTASPLERHDREDDDLAFAPMFSGQSRDLAHLLDDWRRLDRDARVTAVAGLKNRYDDAVVLTGAARIVAIRATLEQPSSKSPAAAQQYRDAADPAPAPARSRSRSPLLFHYHIFKNAGTSVDRMLKANFGDRWAEREFSETPPSRRHASIRAFLEERPGLQAFSSHTAPLPEPDLADREIVPVLFVRHPLLRVRSAYHFERRQDATTRGAILAKATDFRGYVATFLDDPKARQVRNFQSVRLAAGTPGRPAQEPQRAVETLVRLPFVGLVEAYDESVERLGALIRPLFPDFQPVALHENATAANHEASTDEQIAALREELGSELFDRLVDANADDLDLYERVRARYATPR